MTEIVKDQVTNESVEVEHEGILEEGEISYEEAVQNFKDAMAGVMFAFKNYAEPDAQILAATGEFNGENYAIVVAINETANEVMKALAERFNNETGTGS